MGNGGGRKWCGKVGGERGRRLVFCHGGHGARTQRARRSEKGEESEFIAEVLKGGGAEGRIETRWEN